MNVDKLYDLKDSSSLTEIDKKKIDLLLAAITDWPSNIETVEGFFDLVKNFLRITVLNAKSISSSMDKISPEKHLWEFEALSSLLDLAKLNRDQNVDSVISQLDLKDESS